MKDLSVFEQMTRLPYLQPYIDVLKTAMELEIFEDLMDDITAEDIAKKHGWNAGNTEYLLKALVSFGFVQKKGDLYRNTDDASRYMTRESPEYLAGFTSYYMDSGIERIDLKKAVAEGPNAIQKQELESQMDFEAFGRMFRRAQAGLRQKELLDIVRDLPEDNSIKKVLDIGCATGMLGLAVVGDKPDRRGVFFDRFPANIIMESAKMCGLENRSEVITGDFFADDIGSGYDLIIGISMMLFAKGNIEALLLKFHDALNPGGVVLLINEGIDLNDPSPWDMYLGYLPYYMQGMNFGIEKGEIKSAAEKVGYSDIAVNSKLLCYGTQDVIVLRK